MMVGSPPHIHPRRAAQQIVIPVRAAADRRARRSAESLPDPGPSAATLAHQAMRRLLQIIRHLNGKAPPGASCRSDWAERLRDPAPIAARHWPRITSKGPGSVQFRYRRSQIQPRQPTARRLDHIGRTVDAFEPRHGKRAARPRSNCPARSQDPRPTEPRSRAAPTASPAPGGCVHLRKPRIVRRTISFCVSPTKTWSRASKNMLTVSCSSPLPRGT